MSGERVSIPKEHYDSLLRNLAAEDEAMGRNCDLVAAVRRVLHDHPDLEREHATLNVARHSMGQTHASIQAALRVLRLDPVTVEAPITPILSTEEP